MKREFLALPESAIAGSSKITGGSVIGRSSVIEADAVIDSSVIGDGAIVGERARLTNCFVAPGFSVPGDVIAENNFFGF